MGIEIEIGMLRAEDTLHSCIFDLISIFNQAQFSEYLNQSLRHFLFSASNPLGDLPARRACNIWQVRKGDEE